jgi:hypothetical protein
MESSNFDKFEHLLEYPHYVLLITDIGPSFAKAFVAVKQITNKTTKETKELFDSPFPMIVMEGTKRSLNSYAIQLNEIGVTNTIGLIDKHGELHWSGRKGGDWKYTDLDL